MPNLQVLLMLFGLYALPVAISQVAILLLGRKRGVRWMVIEYCYLLLPFLVWMTLLVGRWVPKHDANLLEAFFVGIPGGLVLLPRLYLPAPTAGRKMLITYLSGIAASLVAAAIYFFTPAL